MNLTIITNLLSAINLGNIISLFIGGLITGLISYKFLQKREKDKLKKDLQIKATEEILEIAREVNDKASRFLFPDFTSFQGYNDTLSHLEKNKPSSGVSKTDSIISDLHNSQLNQAKDEVRNCMNNFFENRKEYAFSYCRFLNIFETKLVILNKFIGINELLSDKFKEIMDIETKIMDLYHFEISTCVTYSRPIENDLIEKMAALDNRLLEIKADIMCIYYDLSVALQNEFLSDVFGFKIPCRQPIDSIRFPVYKAGYKHIRKQEEFIVDEREIN